MAKKNVSSAGAALVAALKAPNAPRALLVSLGDDGQLQYQPVERGQSVLRIEDELRAHLDSKPYATEWLVALREYLDQRLAAQAEARRTGGFVLAYPREYVVAHIPAFQPLQVSHG